MKSYINHSNPNLEKFNKIGWDIDETLLLSTNSEEMLKYIINNQHQEHYIVTYRTHDLLDMIFSDFKKIYPHIPIKESHFKDTLHLTDEEYENYAYSIIQKNKSDDDNDSIYYYNEFKGRICNENGIEILFEDKIIQNQEFFDFYDIVLAHPDDFLKYL